MLVASGARLLRTPGVAATVLAALALGAAPALAAQRYAAPVEVGAKDCSSPANACGLARAIEDAQKGDEVIVEPGSYGTAGSPLSSIESGVEDLDVHGVDAAPGPPGAAVHSDGAYGISLYGAGDTISDLEVVDTATATGGSLLLEDATGERLVVRSGPTEAYACVLALVAALSDSLCESEGDVAAVGVNGDLDGPNNVTLRNVTAVAPNGDGVYAASNKERPIVMNVVNTILRGGTADIQAEVLDGASVAVVTSHSNYSAAHTVVKGGAAIVDDGTSQTSGDQGLSELFVAPADGDFRELPGAQTIGAGRIDAANGALDLEGDARTFAPGTSCASTDIGADQFAPAGGPAVSAAVAGTVGETTASLSGTANPLGGPGTAHFDYGPAAPGGGPPASYSSTPAQCLTVGDAAQSVAATLTGLLPDTTYYYRLVAANASATTTPAFTATFTTTATTTVLPTGPPSPPGLVLAPPSVTNLRQSAKAWREGGALARISSTHEGNSKALPVGTTLSFGLNETASVAFTFTRSVGGHMVGTSCVALAKRNERKHRCTRTVIAGTLTFTGHAGTDKVRFDGLISARHKLTPGSYTLRVVATVSARRSTTSTLRFTIVA